MSKSDRSDFDWRAASGRPILDFKVQMRSGLPCDEWEGVAGVALRASSRFAYEAFDITMVQLLGSYAP